jgi:hypothetical protein
MRYTDAEFIEELESFLDVGNDSGIKPSAPVFYTASGAVNRSKTLESFCFDGMTEQKKAELSQ